MTSVGETIANENTFQEALQKAMRSLEIGSFGFEPKLSVASEHHDEALKIIREKLQNPNAQRLWYLGDGYRFGMMTDEIYQLSTVDPWFLEKNRNIIQTEKEIENYRGNLSAVSSEL